MYAMDTPARFVVDMYFQLIDEVGLEAKVQKGQVVNSIEYHDRDDIQKLETGERHYNYLFYKTYKKGRLKKI